MSFLRKAINKLKNLLGIKNNNFNVDDLSPEEAEQYYDFLYDPDKHSATTNEYHNHNVIKHYHSYYQSDLSRAKARLKYHNQLYLKHLKRRHGRLMPVEAETLRSVKAKMQIKNKNDAHDLKSFEKYLQKHGLIEWGDLMLIAGIELSQKQRKEKADKFMKSGKQYHHKLDLLIP